MNLLDDSQLKTSDDPDSVKLIVCSIIADYNCIGYAGVTPETTWKQLDMDSLDQVQAALDLENYFGIEIGNEVLFHATKVGDIIDYIRGKRTEEKHGT